MKRSSRNALILLALFGVGVATVCLLDSKTYYAWKQKRMVKRVLDADPAELLSAGRMLLATRPGFVGEISPSSPDIPRAIRRLKPTRVALFTNHLEVDFSDLFNPFGILDFANGASPPPEPEYGRGPRQWIESLWVYDDGQLQYYRQGEGLH